MKTEIYTVFEIGDQFLVRHPNGAMIEYIVTDLGIKTLMEHIENARQKEMERQAEEAAPTNRHYPQDIDVGGYCNRMVFRNGGGDTCGLQKDDPVHFGHHPDGDECFYELCGGSKSDPCNYNPAQLAKFQAQLDEEEMAK